MIVAIAVAAPMSAQMQGPSADPAQDGGVIGQPVIGPPDLTFDGLSVAATNVTPALPLGDDLHASGPQVLHVQTLLDRAFFSVGMISGWWGNDTYQAVRWFQDQQGIDPTGVIDSLTYARLYRAAGAPGSLTRVHVLSATDVSGPFVEIPDDIYEHAELPCSCYQSLAEKLSELFHTTRGALRQLNPGVHLDSLKAGDRIHVPHTRGAVPHGTRIAGIVISGSGNYLHALDGDGQIIFHFATTMGSDIDPSPAGEVMTRQTSRYPTYTYRPSILAAVPDTLPVAVIPPGPNSSVGTTWIALSLPHYGIHGTRAPEWIGYEGSAGCVRLTNWDAALLAAHMRPGIPVRFEDTSADTRIFHHRPDG